MSKEQKRQHPNRRDFILGTTGLAMAAMLPGCVAAAKKSSVPADLSDKIERLAGYQPQVGLSWIPKGEHTHAYASYKKCVDAVTDFSWLSKGDRVLVKLALNSGNTFPATTDPWSVSCMVKLLKEKGAGKVLVGDQSGVEAVHWTRDSKKGASRELAQNATLLKTIEESGAEPVFFEEQGWDSYFPATPAKGHHWQNPIYLPGVLKEIDHIVYLPRVSSHILAGNTLGLKLGVGFLRSDSRGDFHKGGKHFYAMYEEINTIPEIASRLRLSVSSGRKIQTLFGPDRGPVAEPDYGLLIASGDLLAHELAAYAWLQWNREFMTSKAAHKSVGRWTRNRSVFNTRFSDNTWGKREGKSTPGIEYFKPGSLLRHPAIANNWQRQGGAPEKIRVETINAHPDDSVSRYLEARLK